VELYRPKCLAGEVEITQHARAVMRRREGSAGHVAHVGVCSRMSAAVLCGAPWLGAGEVGVSKTQQRGDKKQPQHKEGHLNKPCKGGVCIPILQLGKLRPLELWLLAQGYPQAALQVGKAHFVYLL
jgi:hypothetical protein